MRLKKCKRCGKNFEAASVGTYLCAECALQARRDSVYRARKCAVCGAEFIGAPRAKYCADCRAEVKRQRNREHYGKTVRPLGSTDLCVKCGEAYTVASGRQKYCPACAKDAVNATVRAHKRAYMAKNKDAFKPHKEAMRSNNKVCVICGNVFDTGRPDVTCSDACAAVLRHRQQRKADIRRGKCKTPVDQPYLSGLPQSDTIGVSYHRRTGHWQANVGKAYLGLYDTEAKAVDAVTSFRSGAFARVPAGYVTLDAYAALVGKSKSAAFAHYQRGRWPSAQKIGSHIWIDPAEPWPTGRTAP